MALNAGEIEVILRAKDMASATLKHTEEQIKSLDNAAGKTTTTTQDMSNAWGTLGKVLAAVGVAKVVADVVRLGSELDDLSDKTGIGVEALQRLKLAADLNGTSIDSLSNAIVQMGIRISRGEDSAVSALDDLGLSLEAMRAMSPDQQFIALAHAIQKIPDPMKQAELAVAVGGRSMSSQLAVLRSDVAELESGMVGMSARAAEGLDRLDRAWVIVKTTIRSATGEIVAAMTSMDGLRMVTNSHYSTALKMSDAMQQLTDETNRQVDALAKAAKGSDDLTKKYKDMVPALASAWEADRAVANSGIDERIKKNVAAWEAYNDRVREHAQILNGTRLKDEVRFLADALRVVGGEANISATEHARLGTELRELVERGAKLPPELHKIFVEHLKLSDLVPEVTGHIDRQIFAVNNAWPAVKRLGDQYLHVSNAIKEIADVVNKTPIEDLLDLNAITGQKLEDALRQPGRLADEWVTAFERIGEAAAIMGGEIGQALGAVFAVAQIANDPNLSAGERNVALAAQAVQGGMAWFDAAKQGNRGKGAAAGAATGASVGAYFAGATGGLSIAVGAGIGAIAGALTSGGPSTNDIRDMWMAQLGGLQAIQEEIGKFANDPILMGAFSRLYNTDDQTRFHDAALQFENRLQELMDERKSAQDRLNAAIEKYGFTIDELGPKLQQQKLSEQAKELIMDYTALTAAGIDVGLVTEKMAAAVNEYLAIALRTGIEVPQAMRPMLEKMVEMGLLTNENGEKLTDLKTIPFAETLSQGFDRVIAKLDELIRKLVNDLPDAIYDIPDVEVGVSGPGEQAGPTRPPSLQNPGGGESPIGAATGAYVMAKPGGTHMIVGEGGEDEVILPVSRLGGGNHYSFNISTLSPREFSEFLKDGGISVIVSQVEDNVRGSRTGLQQAVGLPVK